MFAKLVHEGVTNNLANFDALVPNLDTATGSNFNTISKTDINRDREIKYTDSASSLLSNDHSQEA